MKASKQRVELARQVRDAGLKVLAGGARWERVMNVDVRFRTRTLDGFEFMAWDEFSAKQLMTGHCDFKKGIEIRDATGKLFSFYWDPIKRWVDPEYLMAFKSGDWPNRILELTSTPVSGELKNRNE